MAPKPWSYVEYVWLWRFGEIKQKTPRTRILWFSARKKTRAKSLCLLKNWLLIRIAEILKEQNSSEKLIFHEKRASRSTFAPHKNIKIKKAEIRTRSLLFTENGAETRKWCFLGPFWASKWTKKDEFIVVRSSMWRKYRTKTMIFDDFWRMPRAGRAC